MPRAKPKRGWEPEVGRNFTFGEADRSRLLQYVDEGNIHEFEKTISYDLEETDRPKPAEIAAALQSGEKALSQALDFLRNADEVTRERIVFYSSHEDDFGGTFNVLADGFGPAISRLEPLLLGIREAGKEKRTRFHNALEKSLRYRITFSVIMVWEQLKNSRANSYDGSPLVDVVDICLNAAGCNVKDAHHFIKRIVSLRREKNT